MENINNEFRNRFLIPTENGKEKIYFLGNSLGLQPKTTEGYVKQVLKTWSDLGVEGFFEGENPWMDYHQELAEMMAPIVGAYPEEIAIMNALTVNLHLMMESFYRPEGRRHKIICEAGAFPSDQYLLESQVKRWGYAPEDAIVEVFPEEGKDTINEDDILAAIDASKDELAMVLWGGVNYYTGQVFDIGKITKAAHEAGAVAGFDLAHAAGNIELKLHEWEVDFACWCNYKYLNAGPGAVASAFIHKKFHQQPMHRMAGWWGYRKDRRFLMQKGFVPGPSAEGWHVSTPPIMLYACLKAALEIFSEAGMENLRKKGKAMSNHLLGMLEKIQEKTGGEIFRILTPREESKRGCQISLLFNNSGRLVFDHIMSEGIFADWREPNVIRVAPVPLYNTFEEIDQFARVLENTLDKIKTA